MCTCGSHALDDAAARVLMQCCRTSAGCSSEIFFPPFITILAAKVVESVKDGDGVGFKENAYCGYGYGYGYGNGYGYEDSDKVSVSVEQNSSSQQQQSS